MKTTISDVLRLKDRLNEDLELLDLIKDLIERVEELEHNAKVK